MGAVQFLEEEPASVLRLHGNTMSNITFELVDIQGPGMPRAGDREHTLPHRVMRSETDSKILT